MGTLVKLRVAHETEPSRSPSALVAPPVIGRTLVRSPELSELRAFCAAVDLGSIGRAARLIQVSQPALSKRLKTLEAIAGTAPVDALASRRDRDAGRVAPVRRGSPPADGR